MAARVELVCRVERKHAQLARFLVIPAQVLRRWRLARTTTVMLSVQGTSLGRRSLKKWDGERWFVELTEAHCRSLGVDTGARVRVAIERADETLPAELAALLVNDRGAASRWRAMTPAQQRMLREEVGAAKASATRARRASLALTAPVAKRPRPLPRDAERATIAATLTIDDPVPGVALAMQRGRDGLLPPQDETKGRTTFVFEVDVVLGDPVDWRGELVHGVRGGRFLYVNSGRRAGAAGVVWDRRAKIALPGLSAAEAARAAGGRLVARMHGRAKDGGPACASVPLLDGGWRVVSR